MPCPYVTTRADSKILFQDDHDIAGLKSLGIDLVHGFMNTVVDVLHPCWFKRSGRRRVPVSTLGAWEPHLQWFAHPSTLQEIPRKMRFPHIHCGFTASYKSQPPYRNVFGSAVRKHLYAMSRPRPHQGKVSSASRLSASAEDRAPTMRRRTSPLARFRLLYSTQAPMYEANRG
jgi:hypothetical protein